MGKTRPPERSKLARKQKKAHADKKRKNRPSQTPEQLLNQAVILLSQNEPDSALALANAALTQLKDSISADEDVIKCLPALNLLGEINVEIGEIDVARQYFQQAADIDDDGGIPEEQGGGADKFMWLAQLSEEGGEDSVKWFEKGAQVLRQEIKSLEEDAMGDDDEEAKEELLEDKKAKLSTALCAIAEVYMTDLSWDDKRAEEVCNRVTAEALKIAPNNPETLQTVASVRISQSRKDEARDYLVKSLSLWQDLPVDSLKIPDFPTRVSLARLLMEVENEDDAIEVIERLIQEDDESIETWYLGGWCLYLIAEKEKSLANGKASDASDEKRDIMTRSRRWLLRCLKLYKLVDYEDERLFEHATELTQSLNAVLGEPTEQDEAGFDEDDWEDDEDEEMEDS